MVKNNLVRLENIANSGVARGATRYQQAFFCIGQSNL